MRPGIGSLDSIEVGMTSKAGRVASFGIVTGGTAFHIALGQLGMASSSGSHPQRDCSPIRGVMPSRSETFIIPLRTMTFLTGVGCLVADETLFLFALGIEGMSIAIIQIVYILQNHSSISAYLRCIRGITITWY